MTDAKHGKRALVYACNDGYAKLAGISMLSYFENNSAYDTSCFILEDGVSEENKKKLHEVADKYDCQLTFFDIKENLKSLMEQKVTGYDNALEHGMTVFGRFFISDIIPEDVERVLYLDCDTLVVGNLEELWNFDMGDNAFAMAWDTLNNEYKRVVGAPLDFKYHNSGVMLVDLKAWNEKECFKRLMDHIINVRSSYPFPDQDILNFSLHDTMAFLPSKYNFQSQLFLYDWKDYKKVYGMDPAWWMTKENFDEAKRDYRILHFCGQTFGRPWYSNSKHPMKSVFDKYYEISPWKDEKMPVLEWQLPYRVQNFCYWHTPKFFSVWMGALMQKVFIRITYRNR